METAVQMGNAEIMKNAMDDFREIQTFMFAAKEEHAVKTYGVPG